MDDQLTAAAPPRRRRSDARRNVEAIVDAARAVLGERPHASMEEIATAAGVTRQTIYAHFPSRDALIAAILEIAGVELVSALDNADLDSRTPPEALSGFLDIGWQLLRRHYPLLLDTPNAHTLVVRENPNHAVSTRLEQIIRRGQRTGDFDRTLPASWLAAAILGLGHTAAEQVDSRGLTTRRAGAVLRESALRLCGATITQH
jgi:AcrR family transcriptional regulator